MVKRRHVEIKQGSQKKKDKESKENEADSASEGPLSELDQADDSCDSGDEEVSDRDEKWLEWFEGFRSYSEPLPENFLAPVSPNEDHTIPERRLRLGSYFSDYLYRAPQSHLDHACYPSAPHDPPNTLIRALRNTQQKKFWSSKKGLTAAQLPKAMQPSFVSMMEEESYLDTVSGLCDSVADDIQTRFAESQLGVDSPWSKDVNEVFDYGTFMNLLTNYISVDLSLHNMLSNEQVRRIVSGHVARHLFASRTHRSLTKGQAATFGWTRPKILILAPTKFIAKQWVTNLQRLLPCSTDKAPRNEERFLQEFYALDEDGNVDPESELGLAMLETRGGGRKPLDYAELFRGDNDDNFRMGIRVSPKQHTFYSSFYNSDVIVASPLGLRLVIGAKGEKGDHDFLSSLEMLVIDRYELIEMQNFDHLRRILSTCNKPPERQPKNVDITKLRPCYYAADGDESCFYRQTIALGNGRSLAMQQLLSIYDSNYRGLVRLWKASPNFAISRVNEVSSGAALFMGTDAKANKMGDRLLDLFKRHFVDVFHPKFAADSIILVVPSWLEYRELKTVLANGVSTDNFAALHERTKPADVTRTRQQFKDGKVPLLVVTERFLFFRRYRISGAKHLVFLGPPRHTSILLDMVMDAFTKGDSTGRFCLTYWDTEMHVNEMERLVGSTKIATLLSKSADAKIVAIHT